MSKKRKENSRRRHPVNRRGRVQHLELVESESHAFAEQVRQRDGGCPLEMRELIHRRVWDRTPFPDDAA